MYSYEGKAEFRISFIARYVCTYEEFVTEAPQCDRVTVTRQDTDNKNNNIQIYKIDDVQNSTNTIYKIDNMHIVYFVYLYIIIFIICVLSCHCYSVALWSFFHQNKFSYVQTYLAIKLILILNFQ